MPIRKKSLETYRMHLVSADTISEKILLYFEESLLGKMANMLVFNTIVKESSNFF